MCDIHVGRNFVRKLGGVALVLFLVQVACSSSSPVNTGVKVTAPAEESSIATSPPSVQTFKVGDLVELKDRTVMLNSVEIAGNILTANFTITNTSSEKFLASLFDFEAKDSEGVKLDQDMFDCSSSLSVDVYPDEKGKGNVCWKAFTTSTARIYYNPDLFGSTVVIWEVSK